MSRNRIEKMHERSLNPPDVSSIADLAISANEAAAVMGVHWTRPKKMASAGLLMFKTLQPAWSKNSTRAPAVYSLHDCESDYQTYLQLMREKDSSRRRPRAHLEDRDEILRRLAQATAILYDDACGAGEASEILRVTPCLILRYAEEGVLRSRKPVDSVRGHEAVEGRWWILSRESVMRRLRQVVAEEVAGKKRGRKKFIDPLDR